MPRVPTPPVLAPHALTALMADVMAAVTEAAELALPYFRRDGRTSARVWSKAGGSPVTEADVAVDTFLKIRLTELAPQAAWLSEETRDDDARLGRDLVWIVDPIDGTRAFLSGHPDWSIAVALLDGGEPALGIVDAPALGTRYTAVRGQGAARDGRPIAVSSASGLGGARVTGPAPMRERLTRGLSAAGHRADFSVVERIPSLALRVARVAEGAVDVGLVSRDARDWDLAGADLVLREAGGVVCGFDGAPAVYNRERAVHGELLAVPTGLWPAVREAWTRGA